MGTSPVVLVGRRADGGRRDHAWLYANGWWARETGWPVICGHHEGPGPFSLSTALNRAAAAASTVHSWDVAVVAGADAVPGSAQQIRAAVELAAASGKLVYAHDHYYSISADGTGKILEGEAEPHGSLAEWPAWPNTFSTLFVVPRPLWDMVGGWDERFTGWGWEDFGFCSACWALGDGFERVAGPVFHLYHERDPELRDGHPGYAANTALGGRYMAARHDRDATLGILREPGGPLA